ncbi:MAG: UDP-N-acetylmuramoyl-L-alanine--D-glutamate ligase [Pseudomonadota bacterium]
MITLPGYQGKKVGVFGLGLSGRATVDALIAAGAHVVAWDDGEAARNAIGPKADVAPIDAWPWERLDALALSPGVPHTHPKPHKVAAKAKAAGVRILGDTELFAQAVNAAPAADRPKIIAVTGTNGKSTTTELIGHLLRAAGVDVRVGGNIGTACLALPPLRRGAVYVLEMSSYQLELTHSLKADVAVFLNLSPDHLDRHGGLAGYIAAKRRIFNHQGEGDVAIIGADDLVSQQICTEIVATNHRTIIPISSGAALGRGVFALDGVLFSSIDGRASEVVDLTSAATLRGAHNWQNAAAAFAAAHAIVPNAETLGGAMGSFSGLPHRLQEVARIGAVTYVNDSKATNAEAASHALKAFPKVRWIAGGVPKAEGIEPLKPLMDRVEKAYLIGEAAEAFQTTIGDAAPVQLCGDLASAVRAAAADAVKAGGDQVVLLSPACASFDQFPNFEARGEAFCAAVRALPTQNGAAA